MKRIVLGMSMERKKLLSKLDAISDTIGEHICKLILYNEVRPNDIEGWAGEIAERLQVISEITCKPNNKKLSKQQYSDKLFAYFGDSESDMKLSLLSVSSWGMKQSPPYPRVNVDAERVEKGARFTNALAEKSVDMIACSSTLSITDFQNMILDLVDQILC